MGKRTMDYLIAGGVLQVIKVGRRTLIPGVELERLIEKGCPVIPKRPARKKGETGSDRGVA